MKQRKGPGQREPAAQGEGEQRWRRTHRARQRPDRRAVGHQPGALLDDRVGHHAPAAGCEALTTFESRARVATAEPSRVLEAPREAPHHDGDEQRVVREPYDRDREPGPAVDAAPPVLALQIAVGCLLPLVAGAVTLSRHAYIEADV